MLCPQCGKEGIEPGDAFCRHCGFALRSPTSVPESTVGVAEEKPGKETNSDTSKGLQLFGAAILIVTALFALVVANWIGVSNFGTSVLPWLSGALMLVGLVMIFIGFELRRAH